jgi:hypothetical protein
MLKAYTLSLILGLYTLCSANDVDDFTLVAIGDWGGFPYPPYHTPHQTATAKGMAKVAEDIGAAGVLALGDNMYFSGVEDKDASKRFKATFEDVYTQESLQKDWFVIAGNHDHYGNVSLQIDYSEKSTRWNFPSLLYNRVFPYTKASSGVKGSVEIIFFDSVTMIGLEDDVPDDQLSFDGSRLNNFPKPPGPRAADPAKDMLDGIKSMMEASTANFLLLAGHHPVYSACEHGNNQILIEQIQPLLEKHNAHYFSGHDHCQVVIFLLISRFSYSFLVFSYSFHQMHIQPPGSAVNYILTGMGDFCCYQASNIDSLPDGEKSLKYILASKHNPTKAHGGFASLRFRGDELTVDIHDQDGVTLYSTPTIPSRSAK